MFSFDHKTYMFVINNKIFISFFNVEVPEKNSLSRKIFYT